MKILGLDSSGLVASVAVVCDDNMLGEYTVNYKKTHSQTLLPMLDEVARMIELDLDSIDAIAVAGGPGSFTGLRIGSATAKGLGLALNKPIINVPTVDALAYNLVGHSGVVCPLMDARRSQTYTGLYRFVGNDTMQTVIGQCVVGIDEIVDSVNKYGEAVTFLGDGVPVFKAFIEEHMTVEYGFAPAHLNKQRAGAVAVLGAKLYEAGHFQTAEEHAPDYLRLSQAERERAEKETAGHADHDATKENAYRTDHGDTQSPGQGSGDPS
jgi:tRNA threonylcarbamoyl adenosine modification protein YeaZ